MNLTHKIIHLSLLLRHPSYVDHSLRWRHVAEVALVLEGVVAVDPDALEGVAGVDLAVALAVAGLPPRPAEPARVTLGRRLSAFASHLSQGQFTNDVCSILAIFIPSSLLFSLNVTTKFYCLSQPLPSTDVIHGPSLNGGVAQRLECSYKD